MVLAANHGITLPAATCDRATLARPRRTARLVLAIQEARDAIKTGNSSMPPQPIARNVYPFPGLDKITIGNIRYHLTGAR
jgi:hypothetical protein